MAFLGPPPRLATPQSVGLHFLGVSGSLALVNHYRNGTKVEELELTDRRAGDRVALGLYSFGGASYPNRYDRVEYRDEPGGTLLGADDFTSLAGWSLGADGGVFSSDGNYAIGSGTNGTAVIYQTLPLGVNYIEIQGCSITGDPRTGDESWMGFKIYRSAGGAGGSFFNSPPDGFLVILRNNGYSEVNDGTAILTDPWLIGMVG